MNGVQSLNRMLDILEYVSENGSPCSLSEITKKTGLPKSTACRIASVLQERGYAAKDSDTGRYIPGLKILSIAGAVLDSLNTVKTAHPFLRELSDKTAETVHLLACDGDYAVYIDKIEYPNTIKLDSQVGKRVPLYCTAAGKALLSQRSEKGNSLLSALWVSSFAHPRSSYGENISLSMADSAEIFPLLKLLSVFFSSSPVHNLYQASHTT